MLKNIGIEPNRGKWKFDEIQTLKDNMRKFLAFHEVRDFRRLIIPRTKEDQMFRRETQFELNMCTGIQRTRAEIYTRILIQFSDFLCKGKYSEEERKELIKLHKLYGNNWKQIGILMNRSPGILKCVYSYFRKSWNKGAWSKEEDETMIKAVEAFLERGEVISWTIVSKVVSTRSRGHCRRRWLSKSIQSNRKGENIAFDKKEIHKLISIIWESNVDDEYLIDWNNLSACFNNTVTSKWLRWKFGVVCKEVPHSHFLEFGEIINQLYNIYQRKIINEGDYINGSLPDGEEIDCNESNKPILGEDDNTDTPMVNFADVNEDVLLAEDSSSDNEEVISNEVIVIN